MIGERRIATAEGHFFLPEVNGCHSGGVMQWRFPSTFLSARGCGFKPRDLPKNSLTTFLSNFPCVLFLPTNTTGCLRKIMLVDMGTENILVSRYVLWVCTDLVFLNIGTRPWFLKWKDHNNYQSCKSVKDTMIKSATNKKRHMKTISTSTRFNLALHFFWQATLIGFVLLRRFCPPGIVADWQNRTGTLRLSPIIVIWSNQTHLCLNSSEQHRPHC